LESSPILWSVYACPAFYFFSFKCNSIICSILCPLLYMFSSFWRLDEYFLWCIYWLCQKLWQVLASFMHNRVLI
jgi:hypothetical protein